MNQYFNINLDDETECEELVKPLQLLADYARYKHEARMARLRGEIEQALDYEYICETIYNRLDDKYKSW